MSTVTVTATSTGFAAHLLVDVAGGAPGETMSVYRQVGNQAWQQVMGAIGIAAEDRLVVDGEVPLNRPVVWWVVTSTGAQAVSAPVTVAAELAVVSDPVTGRRAVVAVVERDDISRDARATVLQVEGDPAPWVVRDVPESGRMPVRLYTRTWDAERGLDAMLAAGGPLLLRCACGFHGDVWIEPVTTSGMARVVRRPANLARAWDLGVCVIYPGNPWPAGTVARGNTLGAVAAAVNGTTLGAIAARWSSLGQIAIAELG